MELVVDLMLVAGGILLAWGFLNAMFTESASARKKRIQLEEARRCGRLPIDDLFPWE